MVPVLAYMYVFLVLIYFNLVLILFTSISSIHTYSQNPNQSGHGLLDALQQVLQNHNTGTTPLPPRGQASAAAPQHHSGPSGDDLDFLEFEDMQRQRPGLTWDQFRRFKAIRSAGQGPPPPIPIDAAHPSHTAPTFHTAGAGAGGAEAIQEQAVMPMPPLAGGGNSIGSGFAAGHGAIDGGGPSGV